MGQYSLHSSGSNKLYSHSSLYVVQYGFCFANPWLKRGQRSAVDILCIIVSARIIGILYKPFWIIVWHTWLLSLVILNFYNFMRRIAFLLKFSDGCFPPHGVIICYSHFFPWSYSPFETTLLLQLNNWQSLSFNKFLCWSTAYPLAMALKSSTSGLVILILLSHQG